MNYGRFDNSNISFCRFEDFGDVYVIFLLHKPLICVRSPDAVKNLLVNGASDVIGRSDWWPMRYIFGQRFFSVAFLLPFQRKSLSAFGHRKSTDMYETIQNLNSIRFNSTHLNPTELKLHDVGHRRELNKNPILMVVNRVCLEFNCL